MPARTNHDPTHRHSPLRADQFDHTVGLPHTAKVRWTGGHAVAESACRGDSRNPRWAAGGGAGDDAVGVGLGVAIGGGDGGAGGGGGAGAVCAGGAGGGRGVERVGAS
ncbi:MAG TPA: hypothetical protein DCZ72_09665, partial [Armatimonadetes bacterium]|nr:hypothetical protein [Armatimonadota bacterium]